MYRKIKTFQEGKSQKISKVKLLLSSPCIQFYKDVVYKCIGYVLVGLGFVTFVYLNGSIVVGDKEAHQATINFPQIFYFSLVAGFFLAPFIPGRLLDTLVLMKKHYYVVTLATIAAFMIVSVNTVAHPYLLADNRHYPFYFWKRLYEWYPLTKFLLVPVYVFLWSFFFASMNEAGSFRLVFFICCVINLVPQLLLEFRYFVPSYLFIRLNMKHVQWHEVLMEFIFYLFVNVVTLYLFIYRPFYWPDSEEMQRFMW